MLINALSVQYCQMQCDYLCEQITVYTVATFGVSPITVWFLRH